MKPMGIFCSCAVLLLVMTGNALAQTGSSQAAASQPSAATLTGRWRVKFALAGDNEKNLILEAKANGVAALHLLDTGPDDKPVAAPQAAAWVRLTNERVSISAEVELALGTCCRELGTLMFKGKFISSESISGKLIFVTSVDEEESPYKFHSLVGTFTASRVPDSTPGG